MSLADNYKILSYTSDGEQTEFPILWRFFDKDTVLAKVYRDGILEEELSYGQDYSVTPTGETGGKLVLTDPVAKGLVLAISRKEPYIQALELLNSGKIDLVKLEEALDHMVMLAQQNRDDLGRGLQVPPGTELTPEQFILDLLTKYEEVMAESTLIQTALGNFFCSSIEPFVTQSGVTEYEVDSKIPLDPILNNLFLVLGGVAQEPVTSFTIIDASHIRFASDPGDGIRCWGVTSLSMSSPDIRLVVEAAIQKIVAEGDNQAERAKEFADAAAQSASEAAEDARDVAADKEHVDTVAGQIQGLEIVVNTLNPGEQATASYDPITGVLTLGVPKGDSGDAAIATPTSLGSIMPQTGDEDGLELGEDGSLRVRKATTTQHGGVLASTTAAAGAAPLGGADGVIDKGWIPVILPNSRLVITESNAAWTPPVTGWARVTVIGGGGGGGKGGGYAVGGSGGHQGGSTSFGNLTAAGGSGGGGGSASSGGGGGESGEIKTEFIRLNASPIKIVIGAGGAGGDVTQSGFPGTAGQGPHGGGVSSIGTQGGGGAPGAGNGNNHIATTEIVRSSGVGGSGAVTKTGYGGGGGGGAGGIEIPHTTSGGAATDSATSGDSSSSNDGGTGGAGGQGAVILEYYDPNKEAV